VQFLMAESVQALAGLEARKAELESQIKAATPDKGNGDDDGEEAADASDDEPAVDEAQLKEWKKQLAALKKEIKAKEQGFSQRLNAAVDGLDESGAADLLLTILRQEMKAIQDQYVNDQRQQIGGTFENWWDKYRITLAEVEKTRSSSAAMLQKYLAELRYV
jgi:type I restriction enzyme M protein